MGVHQRFLHLEYLYFPSYCLWSPTLTTPPAQPYSYFSPSKYPCLYVNLCQYILFFQYYKLSSHTIGTNCCFVTYKVLSISSPELYKGSVSFLFMSSTISRVCRTELVMYEIRALFHSVHGVFIHVYNT